LSRVDRQYRGLNGQDSGRRAGGYDPRRAVVAAEIVVAADVDGRRAAEPRGADDPRELAGVRRKEIELLAPIIVRRSDVVDENAAVRGRRIGVIARAQIVVLVAGQGAEF